MKGKHAQKNFSAVGAMAPTPLSLKTRGGGGGLGGVAYKDWTRPPPRGHTGGPPLVSTGAYPISRLSGRSGVCQGSPNFRSSEQGNLKIALRGGGG